MPLTGQPQNLILGRGLSSAPVEGLVMLEKCVHKETFYQQPEEGVPGTWVVFYWEEDENPACDMHDAQYFLEDKKMAKEFAAKMIQYDDWATSQEEQLAVQ